MFNQYILLDTSLDRKYGPRDLAKLLYSYILSLSLFAHCLDHYISQPEPWQAKKPNAFCSFASQAHHEPY